jgi:hypothetical protein
VESVNFDAAESKADEVLTKLERTDKNAAARKFNMGLAQHTYDKVLDALFLSYVDGSVEAKKARARADDAAETAYIAFLESRRLYDELDNERKTLILRFEYCRSFNQKRLGG